MRALATRNAGVESVVWTDFLEGAREMQAELQDWEALLEQQFGELEFFQAELERQAEATDALQAQLAAGQRQLAEERAATGRLTHQLDQHDARLTAALAALTQLTAEARAEREAAGQRADALRKEFEERESAWKAERDELRTQLAAAVCTLPPTAAAAPVFDDDASRQLAELQEERAVLEAELTLMRSRAADLQEQAAEHKRQLAERQNELTAELKQLREALAAKPWENAPAISGAGAAAAAPPAESSLTITQPPPPAPPAMSAASAEKEKPADPLVNSVMAQFARLQKDVAQRRKQK
jgi:DNA repair exonuclease SbcCD ATPase subunit